MIYHQIFAGIDKGKVKSLFVCDTSTMADIVARKSYGKEAFAVECTYNEVEIDDSYKDGKFYDKNGKERAYWGSEIENINKLEYKTDDMQRESTDNLEQLLDTQFELETTRDEVVDNYEQLLDLQFEVEQLKDNMGG